MTFSLYLDHKQKNHLLILTNESLFYRWHAQGKQWQLDKETMEETSRLFHAHDMTNVMPGGFRDISIAWTSSRLFADAVGQLSTPEGRAEKKKWIDHFYRHMVLADVRAEGEILKRWLDAIPLPADT